MSGDGDASLGRIFPASFLARWRASSSRAHHGFWATTEVLVGSLVGGDELGRDGADSLPIR